MRTYSGNVRKRRSMKDMKRSTATKVFARLCYFAFVNLTFAKRKKEKIDLSEDVCWEGDEPEDKGLYTPSWYEDQTLDAYLQPKIRRSFEQMWCCQIERSTGSKRAALRFWKIFSRIWHEEIDDFETARGMIASSFDGMRLSDPKCYGLTSKVLCTLHPKSWPVFDPFVADALFGHAAWRRVSYRDFKTRVRLYEDMGYVDSANRYIVSVLEESGARGYALERLTGHTYMLFWTAIHLWDELPLGGKEDEKVWLFLTRKMFAAGSGEAAA